MTPGPAQLQAYAASPLAFFADAFAARGLEMAPFQRERFELLAPGLLSLANSEKPKIGRYWIEGVKGSSKDSDVALALLWLVSFSHRPIDGQVGAADADQSNELRKAGKEWLGALPWMATPVRFQNDKLICDDTGCVITFVAADAAGGAHGSRCAIYCINELAHIGKTEFWQTLLDNADKVPDGLVIIVTNAGWIHSPQWNLREQYRTAAHCGFHQFTGPVPWQDARHRDDAQARNSIERFNRLQCGVWSPGTGNTLDPSDISAALDRNLGPMPPDAAGRSGMTLFGGLDLGWKRDHSGFVILGADHTNRRIRLVRTQAWAPDRRTGEVDMSAVEDAVHQAHRDYGLAAVHFDPSQAAMLSQLLRKRFVNMVEMKFVGSNLNLMATTLLDIFRGRCVDLYPDERLIADLRRLTIVEQGNFGGLKLEAARDATGHCDVGVAFSICAPAAVAAMSNPYPAGGVQVLDHDPRELQGLGMLGSSPAWPRW